MSSTSITGLDPPVVAPAADRPGHSGGEIVTLQRPGMRRPPTIDDLLRTYDSMGLGAVVLSTGLRVVGLNARARGLLDGVLEVRGSCLAAGDSANEHKLQGLLGGSASARDRKSAVSEIVVGLARPGRCPLILRRLRGDPGDALHPTVVLIVDPEAQPCPSPASLAETFGLTVRECAVALGLTRGKSIQAIARERRVALKTVRQQVRSILRKTGAKRQSQLVSTLICFGHLVSAAPPV